MRLYYTLIECAKWRGCRGQRGFVGGMDSVGAWVSGWRRSNFGAGGVGQKPAWVNVLLFNHTL